MEKKALTIFLVSIIVVFLDQVTKIFVEKNISNSVSVLGNFFQLTLVKNTGSIFGLFHNQNTLIIWFSIVVIGFILYYYDKIPDEASTKFFVALILGGAIGNLIDRYRVGYVIDFIDFSFWPTFNLADSALTIGIIVLMLYIYKKK